MLVSFIVRLRAEDLHTGAIAGEVHVVATGEQAIVRSLEDLIAVFARGANSSCVVRRSDVGEKA